MYDKTGKNSDSNAILTAKNESGKLKMVDSKLDI